MSDFRIKVNVELDADDLKSKLEKLGGDNEIDLKINTNKIEEQLKGLKKSFKDTFKLDGQVINDLNKISKALEKFNKVSNGVSSTSKGISDISSLIKEYKELGNIASKLEKQLNSGKLGKNSIDRVTAEIMNLKKQMGQIKDQARQLGDSLTLSKMEIFDANQLNKSLTDMHSYMNKVDAQADKIRQTINSLDMNNLGNSSKNELNEILDKVEKIKNEAKDVRLDFDVSSSLNDLDDCLDKVKRIQREAKDVGKSSGGLLGGILGTKSDFLGSFSSLTLANVVGDFLEDGIRETVRAWKDVVVETDSALTDLRKVYDENLSGDSLTKYLNNVTEVAKGTGKTSVDVIQGTAKAVQSGISDINQALVFAEQSAMFSNVGDVSQEQADTMLTAVLSAYGGVEQSLKPLREQVQGAGKDYNNLTKLMDLANHAGEIIA